MDSQGKGLIKGLENWAKKMTKGYRDVDVRDMSSSFRDGLAFCAIIHKYRPDLIDFDSLSKENILVNNQMAFSIAEKQLGVPALLDAEDMVKYTRPDRLSIITYLSQLHNCFENHNKVKSGFKRRLNNITGPSPKVIASEPKLLSVRRIEVCQVCNNRVFILERLIVDGKLYHTACFKCWKCHCILNPGAYIESDTPGKYECSACLPEEKSNGMEADDSESVSSLEDKNHSSLNSIEKPFHPIQNNNIQSSPLSEVVSLARTSFLENSLSPKTNRESTLDNSKLSSPLENEIVTNRVSVKAKITAFESSKNIKSPESKGPESVTPTKVNDSTHSSSSYLNSLNKSPKPSARLSLISPSFSEKSESSIKKYLEYNCALKNDENGDISDSASNKNEISNNKSSCDTLNSDIDSTKPIPSEVPTPDKHDSPTQNVSTNFRTTTFNDSDKIKSLGEYKNPLKPSRDIFQNNIQPLKLTIPTINSSSNKNSRSLPITPLRSASDLSKSPTEIAQIRSTYSKTLNRPLSYTNLLGKEKLSETNKYSLTTPRRRSLDLDKNKETDGKSLDNDSTISGVRSIKNIFSEIDSRGALLKSSDQDKLTKSTPIPTIRLSLEPKKVELQREMGGKSELQSITKILSSSTAEKLSKKSNEVLPTKSPQQEVTITKSAPALELPTTAIPAVNENSESYPDDLNPFGDDEAEDKEEEYPDDLNPFGDEEEEPKRNSPKIFEGVSADNYDESKNPFASDEEDVESYKTPSPRPPLSQNNSPFNTMSSPTGSLRGTTKKRKAPKPPKLSDIFPNDSLNGSPKSIKTSPALSRREIETPSPKLRKSKPPPPPPPVPSPRSESTTQSKNMKSSNANESSSKESKKKKRPAPPVPIPMRKDKRKIPLKEILKEMKEIEAKQREFEKQGREIELLIRDRDKDEEPSLEEEEYIMQLFELVNQKNALFRRQAELMYIKRSQRLEEQQEELEKQIRVLMAKPESEKTDEDRSKEEELIYELTDIVDQRNSIIDSIEMDRRRELEEDVSVQEQIESKNGELPIAAEIKEKSKGKIKKEKKKKEKKDKKKDKHSENGESGKSTLKRKLFK